VQALPVLIQGEGRVEYQEFWDIAAALTQLGVRHGEGDFGGRWDDKLPLNTPGPLYSGHVDNSGPGPYEAPNNIFVDDEGYPFIFRQPANRFELHQVLLAASHDPFSGYGTDGNLRWRLASIRDWWREQHDVRALIAERSITAPHGPGEDGYWYHAAAYRWRKYVQDGMESYLRQYAFFLNEGRLPAQGDVLPDIQLLLEADQTPRSYLQGNRVRQALGRKMMRP
jgi:hypothetical protein